MYWKKNHFAQILSLVEIYSYGIKNRFNVFEKLYHFVETYNFQFVQINVFAQEGQWNYLNMYTILIQSIISRFITIRSRILDHEFHYLSKYLKKTATFVYTCDTRNCKLRLPKIIGKSWDPIIKFDILLYIVYYRSY